MRGKKKWPNCESSCLLSKEALNKVWSSWAPCPPLQAWHLLQPIWPLPPEHHSGRDLFMLHISLEQKRAWQHLESLHQRATVCSCRVLWAAGSSSGCRGNLTPKAWRRTWNRFLCSPLGEAQLGSPILLPRPGGAGQLPLRRMKSTQIKWRRRNNYAKEKVTKFKWSRAILLFSPGHYLGVMVSLCMVLCVLAGCGSLPRSLFCFKTWGFLALPCRASTQPCLFVSLEN